MSICSRAKLGLVAVCLALGDVGLAAALPNEAPLPPRRPADLGTPPPASASPSGPADQACAPLMASGHIIGQTMASVAGPGGCGIVSPVQIEAIVLADGSRVAVSPPAVMRCSLATSVADWVRDDLAPAVELNGDRLVKIDGVGAYECRSRDNIAGAKLSEHARGNAMDLHALVTQSGKTYAVKPSGGPEPAGRDAVMAVMKATACSRFMTVLGPGSDSSHAEHLHVDLQERDGGFRLCQWNLP
jgi:hypothetical protein